MPYKPAETLKLRDVISCCASQALSMLHSILVCKLQEEAARDNAQVTSVLS